MRLLPQPYTRVCFLLLLLGALVGGQQFLITLVNQEQPFVLFWLLASFCFTGCALLIMRKTGGAQSSFGLTALICVGGASLLFWQWSAAYSPNLSHDAWRYLWDAQVMLLGKSPYIYSPDHPELAPLWSAPYSQYIDYRRVPTIYPPFAEALYLSAFILSPHSLFGLRLLFWLFFCLMILVLMYLLRRQKQDPWLVMLVAWNPLITVESGLQTHIDICVASLLICIFACQTSRNSWIRRGTGLLLALATLLKLYPMLLLPFLLKGEKRWLLAGFASLMLLAYLPFLLLGGGQVFGFLSTYTQEVNSPNAGPLMFFFLWITSFWILPIPVVQTFALLFLGTVIFVLWRLYHRGSMSLLTAMIFTLGAFFSIAPHIYPWYTQIILPLLLLAWRPRSGLAMLALILGWYMTGFSQLAYLAFPSWALFQGIMYGIPLLVFGGLSLWYRCNPAHHWKEKYL